MNTGRHIFGGGRGRFYQCLFHGGDCKAEDWILWVSKGQKKRRHLKLREKIKGGMIKEGNEVSKQLSDCLFKCADLVSVHHSQQYKSQRRNHQSTTIPSPKRKPEDKERGV